MLIDRAGTAPFELASSRVHEAQGPGRRGFAMVQAASVSGALIWITPGHAPQLPMLWGLPAGLSPRLHIVRPASEIDLLWAAEEALRSRGAGLVVAEPEKPLSLTAGRRLQLAAEAGRTTGLVLIRDGQGSNAAQTRWHCTPLPAQRQGSTLHDWRLIKNKTGTLGSWAVQWNGAKAVVHPVSATAERDGNAETPR